MAEFINATDSLNEGRKKLNAIAKEMNDKEVASMPEIVNARNGEPSLKARLDKENQEVTAQLAQTDNDVYELDISKADKTETESINERIDAIITTPAENINEQEIIDARDNEVSLGKNIRNVKVEVSDAATGTNNDEYDSLKKRIDGLEKTLDLDLKHRSFSWERGAIEPDGSNIGSLRVIRTDRFITRDVIIKPKHTLEISIFEYNLNNVFLRRLRTETTDKDIVLKTDLDRKYKLHVFDPTKTEDSVARLTSLIDIYEIDLEKDKTTEIIEVNELPVDRRKFDDKVTEINLPPFVENKINALLNLDGSVTIGANAGNGLVNYRKSEFFKLPSDFSHVEIRYKVENLDELTNFSYRFRDVNGLTVYGHNMVALAKEVIDDDVLTIRLPIRKHNVPPTFDFTRVEHISFDMETSGNSKITVLGLSVIQRKKGVVYMYFDDGDQTQYDTAFPILQKYGLRGTVGVMTSYPKADGWISWDQLHEMQNSGWLIASHGYDSKSLATIPLEDAEFELKQSQQDLFERGFIFGSKCFVAPQTSWSDEIENIAKKYYHLARTYSYSNPRLVRGVNERTQEFPQNHVRGQYTWLPYYKDTVQSWKEYIDLAIERKEEISIGWHRFGYDGRDEGVHKLTMTPEFLEDICVYIRQKIDEGVLDCVTWEDTMLQSKNSKPIDLDGNQYMSTKGGQPVLINLE